MALYTSNGLEVAVGHLNASVGPKLTAEQLAAALRAGTTHHLPESEASAAALIHSLFAELSPGLIMACATEAGADLRQVDQLYRESKAEYMPVPAWEDAVRALL